QASKEETMTNPERAQLDALTRTSLYTFARRAFPTIHPGKRFLVNWHHQAVCHHLELVTTGTIRRLIINAPPRSLKSFLCSVAYTAFLHGQDPTKRIISVSYGSELAIKFANDTRNIM